MLFKISLLIQILLLIPIGIVQISSKIRKDKWKLHIRLGRLFALSATAVIAGQIYFSFNDNFSLLGASGIRLTAFVLLGFLFQGLNFMRRRRMFAHGIWMKRTLSAIIAVTVSNITVFLICIENMTDSMLATAYLIPAVLAIGGYEAVSSMKKSGNSENSR